MAEHRRVADGAGQVWQWVDDKRYIVLDIIMNRIEHIAMTEPDAVEWAAQNKRGWEFRTVIMKMDCIAAYRVSQ